MTDNTTPQENNIAALLSEGENALAQAAQPLSAKEVEILVEETKKDPGAPFAFEMLARIGATRRTAPADFMRLWARLKKETDVKMGELERALGNGGGEEGRDDSEPSVVDLLLELVEHMPLFRRTADEDPDTSVHATIEVNGHSEVLRLKSRRFRTYLRKKYFDAFGKGAMPEQVACAVETLVAKGMDAERHDVHLRVARKRDEIFIDVGDEKWRQISVRARGWRVVDSSPVKFSRPDGATALPLPVRAKGGLDLFRRKYMARLTDTQFILIVVFILSALAKRAPLPILFVVAQGGKGKSTIAALIRALIDPRPYKPEEKKSLGSPHGDEWDAFVSCQHNYVRVCDNVSRLGRPQSDTACKISTGGSTDKRTLFTDGDCYVLSALNPQIFTSISNIISRSDLASRAFLIKIDGEYENKTEEALLAEFEKDAPVILGALLDLLVVGLKRQGSVDYRNLPRMADAARWGVACETGAWPQGTVVRALEANRREARAALLNVEPIADALLAVMEKLAHPEKTLGAHLKTTPTNRLTCTMTELLSRLEAEAPDHGRRVGGWPHGPRALGAQLNEMSDALEAVGVFVSRRRSAADRFVTVTYESVEEGDDFASELQSSADPETTVVSFPRTP